jgi:dipeptidase E
LGEALREVLSGVGLVWVTGGNTFTLRRAMKETGFDKILPDLLQKKDFVYGGFSAGVCVLSPSLKGIDLCDHPERVPAGYSPEVIWEGLGLIDFYIVPHYRSNHPESEMMEDVVKYYDERNLKHYDLHDGQAIVVNGHSVEVFGTIT